SLKQSAHIAADAEHFVNEVDIFHAACDKGIDFRQHGFYFALTKMVAEKRLVAERAGPGTSARELEFDPETISVGKDVMPVTRRLDVVVIKGERRQCLHVGSRAGCADMQIAITLKTAPHDLVPRQGSQLRQRLVGFTTQHHTATCLAHYSGWRGRAMRADQ